MFLFRGDATQLTKYNKNKKKRRVEQREKVEIAESASGILTFVVAVSGSARNLWSCNI